MVFAILIGIFIGVVAFFHYVQGFFSATISAMIAVIAAVMAVSYQETVVHLLLKGQMADYANGMVLCMIFAVVYIVLRTIFDMAVPGNVRTPATLDKVGAGVMGLVAGVFVTGIFAIAVQMLPFDPGISFMGYSRYPLRDNLQVVIRRTSGPQLDTKIFNEMDDNELAPDKQKGLLLPVDDWVLDTVYHLSDGGSLAGDRPLASVHPDYLQELFGERLGIQAGARRTSLEFGDNHVVDVESVYSVPSLPVVPGEPKEYRRSDYTPLYKGTVKPRADQRILVVRIKLKHGVTDDADGLFRFSPGSIHLVGKGHNDTWKDFYPIGTLTGGNTVLLNKPDDFLFAKEDGAIDAVFVVDDSLLVGGKTSNKLAPGTLITVKRAATLDLSDKPVQETIPSDPSVQLVMNEVFAAMDLPGMKLPPPNPTAVAPPQANASPGTGSVDNSVPAPITPPTPTPDVTPTPITPPAEVEHPPGKSIAPSLTATVDTGVLAPGFHGIGVNTADAAATDTPVAGGTITFKAPGAISVAKIDPTATLAKLGDGTSSLTQFYCPTDKAMVQICLHQYSNIGWAWIGQLASIDLVDANGNKYAPNGCYELAKVGDSDGLFVRYDAEHNVAASSPDAAADGDIYFIFLIPHDTQIKSFTVGAKTQDLDNPTHVN
jgi:uncharacterized membrane protein required for colicin V production